MDSPVRLEVSRVASLERSLPSRGTISPVLMMMVSPMVIFLMGLSSMWPDFVWTWAWVGARLKSLVSSRLARLLAYLSRASPPVSMMIMMREARYSPTRIVQMMAVRARMSMP